MTEHSEVPTEIVERIRAVCLALPQAYEEPAWVGTRWCIRAKTFAHVLMIDNGWPPVYAKTFATDGPLSVMTFQSSGQELEAFSNLGDPFVRPVWRPDIVGLKLGERNDWDEIAELLTESYCLLAPKKLAAMVERPIT